MDEKTFQFALLGATLIGTVVAVFVGRLLDKNEKSKRTISIDFDKASSVIDLSARNILLAPKGTQIPIERVYERDLSISNIGFGLVEDLEVVWTTNYADTFDSNGWVDFDIKTDPPGIRHEFEDLNKTDRVTRILIKFKFLNRGDVFRVRTTCSSEFSFELSAHHAGTEIRLGAGTKTLPTFREKVGKVFSEKQIIQLVTGVTAAAAAASLGGLFGM